MPRNPNWTRDELILALDLYFKYAPAIPDRDHPEVVELSKLLNNLPIHAGAEANEDFRNPNGVSMKLSNYLRFDPNYTGKGLQAGGKLEEEIWNEFSENKTDLSRVAQAIKLNYSQLKSPRSENEENELIDEEEEFSEGKVLTRTHRIRERNASATKKKKKSVFEKTGTLECEACGFDFAEKYGKLGYGFAECHHNKPVSELKPGEKTKINDLSIICANCHRIIHKTKPWLSVEGLKAFIEG